MTQLGSTACAYAHVPVCALWAGCVHLCVCPVSSVCVCTCAHLSVCALCIVCAVFDLYECRCVCMCQLGVCEGTCVCVHVWTTCACGHLCTSGTTQVLKGSQVAGTTPCMEWFGDTVQSQELQTNYPSRHRGDGCEERMKTVVQRCPQEPLAQDWHKAIQHHYMDHFLRGLIECLESQEGWMGENAR